MLKPQPALTADPLLVLCSTCGRGPNSGDGDEADGEGAVKGGKIEGDVIKCQKNELCCKLNGHIGRCKFIKPTQRPQTPDQCQASAQGVDKSVDAKRSEREMVCDRRICSILGYCLVNFRNFKAFGRS